MGDCYWESGCANRERCTNAGTCLARLQREIILEAGRHRNMDGNNVSVLKLRIKSLESSNRSLLDRIKNQAEMIRSIDTMLQAAVLKTQVAAGMMEGVREYVHDQGIEEIKVSGGVDGN